MAGSAPSLSRLLVRSRRPSIAATCSSVCPQQVGPLHVPTISHTAPLRAGRLEASSPEGGWSGPWGWCGGRGANGHLAEPLPGDARAEFMIVSSSGQIAPRTAHDHESALQRGLAHGNVEAYVVGVIEGAARLAASVADRWSLIRGAAIRDGAIVPQVMPTG